MRITIGTLLLITLLAVAVPSHAEPVFEQPLLLSSAGGSVDIKLAGVLLQRLDVEHEAQPAAQPSDLDGVGTLVMVPGYSSKGLGSAGISRDEEMSRVTAMLEAARERGIPVLTLHLGGAARRGAQSDPFNRVVAEASEMLIVVAQGDEDGFFTSISEDEEIPMVKVEGMAGAMEPLGEVIVK